MFVCLTKNYKITKKGAKSQKNGPFSPNARLKWATSLHWLIDHHEAVEACGEAVVHDACADGVEAGGVEAS